MPVELQIIHASDFIRLDPGSHLNFEESKRVLQDLAHACRKRGIDRALIDLRSLPVLPKPRFTPTQLAALVSTFREAGFSREQRLAILYQHDIYGGVRSFAFISRMRGLSVQAFTEFEAAFQWLSEVPENTAELAPGEIPVPIIRPQTPKRPVSRMDKSSCTSRARPGTR